MNGHALKLIAAFCLCLAGAFLAFRFFGPIGGGPDVKQERQSANASTTSAKSRPASIPEAATGAQVQKRIDSDLAAGRPIVVHVVTALCDNKYQGIVRVPKQLGNGQDPANNLYWGALYGVRTFFKRSREWSEQLGIDVATLADGIATLLNIWRRNSRLLYDDREPIYSHYWHPSDKEIANGFLPLMDYPPKGLKDYRGPKDKKTTFSRCSPVAV